MIIEKIIFYALIGLLFYPIILFYVCVLVVMYYGLKGKIEKK